MEVTHYSGLCLLVACYLLIASGTSAERNEPDLTRMRQARQMYSPYGPAPVPPQLPPPSQPFQYVGNPLHAYPNEEDIWKSQKLSHIFKYEVDNAEKMRKKAVAVKVVSIVGIALSASVLALALLAHHLKKKTIFARTFREEDVDELLTNVLDYIQKAVRSYEEEA